MRASCVLPNSVTILSRTHAVPPVMATGGPGLPLPARTRAARWLLPYGVWTCADGREVLFNRRYVPMLERCPGGPVTAADPAEWVPFVRQSWFYSGQHSGAESRKRAVAALRAWGLTASHGTVQGGRA